jgi:hypothetical protein
VDLPEQEQAGSLPVIRSTDTLGGVIAHSGEAEGVSPHFLHKHTSKARELSVNYYGLSGLRGLRPFAGKKRRNLWYYRELVTAFRQHGSHTDLIDDHSTALRTSFTGTENPP